MSGILDDHRAAAEDTGLLWQAVSLGDFAVDRIAFKITRNFVCAVS